MDRGGREVLGNLCPEAAPRSLDRSVLGLVPSWQTGKPWAQDLRQQLGRGGRQLSWKGAGGWRRGHTRSPSSRDGDHTELDLPNWTKSEFNLSLTVL